MAELTYITAAAMIPVPGGASVPNPVVCVEGERIKTIGTRDGVEIPAGANTLDLGSRTIFPGLIDAHTHCGVSSSTGGVARSLEPTQRKLIRAVRSLETLLEAGVTATRDFGYDGAIHLRDAIQAGEIIGPRMVCPHMMITQTGGSPDPYWLPRDFVLKHDYRVCLADGVDAVIKASRRQIRAGADFLKIMASGGLGDRHGLEKSYHYTLPELEAIVEEGHKLGLRVAAHAVGAEAVKNCVRAGVDTVEHGSLLDDEAIDMLAASSVIFVPTLMIIDAFANADESFKVDAVARSNAARSLDKAMDGVGRALRAGVRIAAGTDSGSLPIAPAGRNWREAELLVAAGMSSPEALEAITVTSAEAMGRQDSLGTLEVGKYADIVGSEVNPLDDIAGLRSIDFVMKGGAVVR